MPTGFIYAVIKNDGCNKIIRLIIIIISLDGIRTTCLTKLCGAHFKNAGIFSSH